ncbi:MAG: polyprenol monophosphomannose synthase [Phycisphaerales bacterium]|nr:MAG: polyprenol monophosphomannose synthase [Phycisphaerales bacterium]
MPPNRPRVSIIVPTYREADNLRPLTRRVFEALREARLDAELIIVDDNSCDGSAEIVDELRAQYPVRIVVRTTERGLSSAVLRGFAEARHDILVVLDADLSHPPEMIPELVRCIDRGHADFVIGSRYVTGAHIEASWSFLRRLNSRVATLLARPLTPARDPMSGFFALSRATLSRAAPLDPIGYKIGLELMVKARCRTCVEVPITFADRTAGASKLTFAQQVRYLRHLMRLYRFRLTAGARR